MSANQFHTNTLWRTAEKDGKHPTMVGPVHHASRDEDTYSAPEINVITIAVGTGDEKALIGSCIRYLLTRSTNTSLLIAVCVFKF